VAVAEAQADLVLMHLILTVVTVVKATDYQSKKE
jgi:hypothetical protein